ncbi:MAG: hypothetical protein EBT08_09785 [Betaproteobacteria bacterium]|nr:hypothetical protein [Betaproteobacteria bacterium]
MQFRTSLGGETVPMFVHYAPSAVSVEAWSLADGSDEPKRPGSHPHVTAVLRVSRHYFGLTEGAKQQAA